MPKYKVLRRHDGDKEYHDGDERTLSKAEAKHLVDLGVLQEIGGDEDEPADEAAKSETAPANKAEKASPKNKAAH